MTGPSPPPAPACDITFFVACLNEQAGIIPTIQTIIDTATQSKLTFEIIVIDDASTDDTPRLLNEFVAAHPAIPITVVFNPINRGVGRNFVDAAFLGKGKYYRMICGDDVESPENHRRILSHVGQADIVLSYHNDTRARALLRRFLSRAFTVLVNLLSGHHIRYYNNMPVFLRQDVLRWQTGTAGFGFQAELVTRLLDLGATYIQVPVEIRERIGGRSKALRLKNLCSVTGTLFVILFRRIARITAPRRPGAVKPNR